jgi:hypothetical protein
MTGERLPDRRASESFSFRWNGMAFAATISRYSDGRLAEIFLTNGKVGSDTDAAARDSAVMCSLALQFGTPVETIRRALLRDAHGVAASPLGRALDLFVGSAP